jgi:hypothetical protein
MKCCCKKNILAACPQGWHNRVLINRVFLGLMIKPDVSGTRKIGFYIGTVSYFSASVGDAEFDTADLLNDIHSENNVLTRAF